MVRQSLITERTGIRERRIAAPGEFASDMATQAAQRAIEQAKISAKDLKLIIVATISPDQPLPSCAVHVQRKLGATCPAFDIAAACAGFLYALDIASRFVVSEKGPVLIVGVELLSRLLDWTDRETCVLFGDGAGAAIIDQSPDPDRGVLLTVLGTDGTAADILQIPVETGFVKMRGSEVFRRAVREISASCKEVLEKTGFLPEEIDHAVFHQANRRILEGISRRTKIPWDRFHLTIDRFGNTSSASIPIGLDHARRNGKIKPGQVVLMAALGAGVVWAASVARL